MREIKYPLIRHRISRSGLISLKDVLWSGWFTQGRYIERAEELLRRYVQSEYALIVNSATSALILAVKSLNLHIEDEVILPSFTFPATANSVILGGARPVFCDIDLNTYNIDPAEIEGLITRRTKAIMVVHQFGLSADMQAITEIAGRHNLSIIEDAACALGAEYKGKKVGSFGSAGVFSFHPRKIITCGEGGCLVTNSSRIAKNISLLRNHGEDNKRFVTAGYNFRLTDIQAALLLSQIGNIEKTIQDRRRLAECYQGLLGGLEGKEMLKTPVSAHPQHSYRHTYQSYVLLLSRSVDRDKLKGLLRKKGIETQFGTYCLPLLNFFKKYFKVPKGSYKNACHAYSQTLTLPLYHGLEKDGQMRIAEALTRYIKKCAG